MMNKPNEKNVLTWKICHTFNDEIRKSFRVEVTWHKQKILSKKTLRNNEIILPISFRYMIYIAWRFFIVLIKEFIEVLVNGLVYYEYQSIMLILLIDFDVKAFENQWQ